LAISIVRRGWSKRRPRKSGCVMLRLKLVLFCGLRMEIGLFVLTRWFEAVAL
jgi:hypothetical protein